MSDVIVVLARQLPKVKSKYASSQSGTQGLDKIMSLPLRLSKGLRDPPRTVQGLAQTP